MKRYFYCDPLAAAWMAKNWGMKFVGGESIYDPSDYFGSDYDYAYEISEQAGPFYIHSDSLHLLEPMVGDLVSINGGESANIATHQEFLEQLEAMKNQFAKLLIIIQRNNMPFHWPESKVIEA